MKILPAWISSKVQKVTSAVVNTVSDVSTSIVSAIKYILSSKGASEFGTQAVDGFTLIFDRDFYRALWNSKKTADVLSYSIKENFIYYLGAVWFYHFAVKRALRSVPNAEGSYVEVGMDLLASTYFISLMVNKYITNTVINLCLSKAVVDEFKHSEISQSCKCGNSAIIQAGVASSFYYAGKVIPLQILSLIPNCYYPMYPLLAYAYGQSLIEYKLAARGFCTEHRQNEFLKNNGYAFGLGLALMMVLEFSKVLFKQCFRTESYFAADALFNFIFQLFMMAILVNKDPFPGEKNIQTGSNLFYLNNRATGSLLDDLWNWTKSCMDIPDVAIKWKNRYREWKDHDLVRYSKKIFAPRDWQTFGSFVLSPQLKIFLDNYEKFILYELDVIEKTKNTTNKYSLTYFLPETLRLFVISREANRILKGIFEYTDGPANGIRSFFKYVRQEQEKHKITFQRPVNERNVAVNNPRQFGKTISVVNHPNSLFAANQQRQTNSAPEVRDVVSQSL